MSQRAVAMALTGVPGCSLASVNRALAGETLVGWPATLAIGEAVGAPPKRIRTLWEKAAANQTPVYRARSTGSQRAPARAHAADRPLYLITQPHELAEAVRMLRARHGQPTYRAMETAARRAGYRLGRSACQAFLDGKAVPTWPTLRGCLVALGAGEKDIERWRAVWCRATRTKPGLGADPARAFTGDDRAWEIRREVITPSYRPVHLEAGAAPVPSRVPGVRALLQFAEEAAVAYAAESHFVPATRFPGPGRMWLGHCASCRRPLKVTLDQLRPGIGTCEYCARHVIRPPGKSIG
ncbi:hypothetical protein EDD39_1631 [Kitasatospora cineracea]|uniref:Uncharacterized protein n=2 Tax=Kitasatospora cineracea TaxID=88074 RepID=A0A8G1UKN6_9ACTN|nr:hypothetical protein EDD39_1631 [Kitasatospora cineracea]